ELEGDLVIVVRFQGPRANGMPELHRLTPALGVLQGRGQRVALLTDGRMSGASGKVPAVIHCTPEAADGGPLARLRDGDIVRIDTHRGSFDVLEVALSDREPVRAPLAEATGTGRELFRLFREAVSSADSGATIFDTVDLGELAAEPETERSGPHEYAV
ncbi:MAG TPA: dihydroxy-acid dehydratase, partial [Solirubrobacteraceae bacterium]|nr:dihydroxy-acid dehydratase [Solirubrobacteraceae bacterium]